MGCQGMPSEGREQRFRHFVEEDGFGVRSMEKGGCTGVYQNLILMLHILPIFLQQGLEAGKGRSPLALRYLTRTGMASQYWLLASSIPTITTGMAVLDLDPRE